MNAALVGKYRFVSLQSAPGRPGLLLKSLLTISTTLISSIKIGVLPLFKMTKFIRNLSVPISPGCGTPKFTHKSSARNSLRYAESINQETNGTIATAVNNQPPASANSSNQLLILK